MDGISRRIGVLGGGQLGRMLGLAGIPLGAEFMFLDPSREASARQVGEQICAPYDDHDAGIRLACSSDVVTYEFEHLHVPTIEYIAVRTEVHPSPQILSIVQDRVRQKVFLSELGIPVAPFHAIEQESDITGAVSRLGLPLVIKTARDGYDGKGQRVVRDGGVTAAIAAWRELGSVRCVAEAFVAFSREVSLVCCRGRQGDVVFYPLVENEHRGGILHRTIAPASAVSEDRQRQAEAWARTLLTASSYVGTFTIEFFDCVDGLVVNEVAPRVHNSGHWTIEGAVTSQFENHVRALMGLPLGSTAVRGHAAMVNIVGRFPDRRALFGLPGVHLHDYGKSERAGRKLGHITVVEDTIEDLRRCLALVEGVVLGSR